MSEKFKLAQLDLGGTVIPQINEDDGISYEFEEFLQRQGGSAAPSTTGVTKTMHKLPFSTQHIENVLDLCAQTTGNEGICEGFDSSDVGVSDQILSFRKGLSRGVRTPLATGEHITQRVTDSFLSWESWSASSDGNAEISCRLALLAELTNSKTATLSSTSVVDEAFKLGPLKFQVTGDSSDREPCILSATWENNIVYDDKACSGADLVHYSGIDEYEPICTVELEDQTQAIDVNGVVAITSFVIYLRAVGESDGATEHIKFTVTAGDAMPGSNNKQLRFRIRSFTIATGVAIT